MKKIILLLLAFFASNIWSGACMYGNGSCENMSDGRNCTGSFYAGQGCW